MGRWKGAVQPSAQDGIVRDGVCALVEGELHLVDIGAAHDCNSSAVCNGVYYAPINSNGSVGSWVNDSANALPQALYYASSVVYNGYVYELGGYNNTSNQTTVYYAPINSNGSVGAWVNDSANPLLQPLDHATSVVYNGYVYELGGNNGIAQSTVYYDQIAPAGFTSAYNSTTNLPNATSFASSVVNNGYIYNIGGDATGTTVDYDTIAANGTLGASWTATGSLAQSTQGASAVAYNGYIYVIGGLWGSTLYSTTYYAKIDSANGKPSFIRARARRSGASSKGSPVWRAPVALCRPPDGLFDGEEAGGDEDDVHEEGVEQDADGDGGAHFGDARPPWVRDRGAP